MKYPLDFENSFDKTLLFWLSRFIRNKITTLSNSKVTNKEKLTKIIQELAVNLYSIEKLQTKVKELRVIGLNGINVYFVPLEKLYIFLQTFGAKSMKEIDEELLSDFLISETTQLSDATKKNYRIALLSFFNYIDKQNQDDNGNTYRYGIELKNWGGLSGKSGTKLPSYMNKDEVTRFIQAIDKYKFSKKNEARNKLIVKIILYTGIRVSEALGIKIKDIVKENNVYMIQIRGKGNKPRLVMVKKSIIENDLNNWLEIRRCNNNLLFCNQKGKSLTQAYLYTIVEKILLEAGIRKEKNGNHMLRHTFATLLYQKSKDLILVQESLGHADINTSRIYTHFDKNQLSRTIDVF
jgi:integrase/recombinase XerD